jgi:L-aspartate oxidase
MWKSAGLFRNRVGLEEVVQQLADVTRASNRRGTDVDSWRQIHLVTVGHLIARAALRREESRGGHFRADFPGRDDQRWKVHVVDHLELRT